MNFTIEQEQESDGRWLAEVVELPGVLAYGANSLEHEPMAIGQSQAPSRCAAATGLANQTSIWFAQNAFP